MYVKAVQHVRLFMYYEPKALKNKIKYIYNYNCL